MTDHKKSAGLLLFYDDGKKNRYLILLNSQTNIWEPAKGLKNYNESFLACAIRECKEETSININLKACSVYSPFKINYNVSKSMRKSLIVFPTKLIAQENVRLSNEHTLFKWIDWEEAKQLNSLTILKPCYYNIICKIEHRHREEIANFKKTITISLREIVINNSRTSNFDWILAGSLAANEFTVYEKKILSDIDLVAVGDYIPESNSIKQINEIIQSNLNQKKKFHKLNVGTMFIDRSRVIDCHTTFGSYLKQYCSYVNPSSNQLKFLKNGSDDNSYNIFRLFWYTSLRSNFYDEIECSYQYLKANLLLFYFKNRTKFPHFSYSNIKNQIVVELSKCTCTKREESLLVLLQAADTKLNHANFLMKRNWKKPFIDELKVLDGKIKTDEYVLMNEIFKIENNKIEVSPALIKLFQLYFDKNEMLDLYYNACNYSDKKFLWVLLILLRIKIWPTQVQFSIDKYIQNIKTLLKESELIQNDTIKNRLSSIFMEFEWEFHNVNEHQELIYKL